MSTPFGALLSQDTQRDPAGADQEPDTRVLPAEEEERLWWTADPHWSDLPEDREMWMVLLAWAYELDGQAPDGLFGSLHGLRCLGARLQVHPSGIRIQPGEIDSGEYFLLRKRYLKPWSDTLTGLLGELAREMSMRRARPKQGALMP